MPGSCWVGPLFAIICDGQGRYRSCVLEEGPARESQGSNPQSGHQSQGQAHSGSLARSLLRKD